MSEGRCQAIGIVILYRALRADFPADYPKALILLFAHNKTLGLVR